MIQQASISDILLNSVKTVFETMVFMDIEESVEPQPEMETNTLLGTITFKGNIEGCLAIRCGLACSKTIATNMLGMEPDEQLSDEEIRDAIGEVSNMIMGQVKVGFEEAFGTVHVSIPMVVSGQNLQNSLGDGASIVSVKLALDFQYAAEVTIFYRKHNG